jgi:hypothetical protein
MTEEMEQETFISNTEEVEQEALVNKIEWRILVLVALIFIVTEELIRHFGSTKALETFILGSIALSISGYISKNSKGFARDALQAVSITACVSISYFLISPYLKNFIPVYLAYGLPIFFLFMSPYIFAKSRNPSTKLSSWLVFALIVAAIFGAISTYL